MCNGTRHEISGQSPQSPVDHPQQLGRYFSAANVVGERMFGRCTDKISFAPPFEIILHLGICLRTVISPAGNIAPLDR
jgi:hypothetical protein